MNVQVCIAVALLFGVALGVALEHYIGCKPKLDQTQVAQAIDLIDAQCGHGEYEKVMALRESFWIWMESPDHSTFNLSEDLRFVIQVVRSKEEKTNWFNS